MQGFAVSILGKDRIQRLISVVLLHQTDFVEKYDAGAHYYLLDELETRLLGEIRQILQGAESDKSTVKRAAQILRESESLMTSISESANSKKSERAGLGGVLKNEATIANTISGLSVGQGEQPPERDK